MEIEDVEFEVGGTQRRGVVIKLTCDCGKACYLNGSPQLTTLDAEIDRLIKRAKFHLNTYSRDCLGRRQVIAEHAFWEAVKAKNTEG